MGKAMLPIGVIADLICEELGDNTGSKKMRILQYIALGYQQMHMYLNKDVVIKTECLEYNGDSIELPNDFMYETKIGLKRGNNICTLHLNTGLNKSFEVLNDTDTLSRISLVLSGHHPADIPVSYYYNSPYGTLEGYGLGFAKNRYYNIQDGMLHLSTCLPDDGETEIIIEYKSDGLSGGLTLVPSEAFLALQEFAHARLNLEGPNGPHQMNYESHYKTLKRTYNFRSIDTLTELFSGK